MRVYFIPFRPTVLCGHRPQSRLRQALPEWLRLLYPRTRRREAVSAVHPRKREVAASDGQPRGSGRIAPRRRLCPPPLLNSGVQGSGLALSEEGDERVDHQVPNRPVHALNIGAWSAIPRLPANSPIITLIESVSVPY